MKIMNWMLERLITIISVIIAVVVSKYFNWNLWQVALLVIALSFGLEFAKWLFLKRFKKKQV